MPRLVAAAAPRSVFVAVALLSACSLDPSGKTRCTASGECLPGYVCVADLCVRPDGSITSDVGTPQHVEGGAEADTSASADAHDGGDASASTDVHDGGDAPASTDVHDGGDDSASTDVHDGGDDSDGGDAGDTPGDLDAPEDGDASGTDGTDGDGDTGFDATDGVVTDGTDGVVGPPPPGVCDSTAVISCPSVGSAALCEQTHCGGRLWRDGRLADTQRVPYRFVDPEGKFGSSYKDAIRAGADAWAQATSGLLQFVECTGTDCSGRFISVVPGDGDGITNPGDLEQFLPMPVSGSDVQPSPHWIAHQWGHVAGLAHTYQRADRDRYVQFDPAVWCGAARAGLPPRCAFTAEDAAGRIASDTFGVFDERSKMNGFQRDGICAGAEPDLNAGPTLGDASAVAELFFSVAWNWSPFRPIGRSVSPTQPLDYQLVPGVDPIGTPAIAVWSSAPEIFVRGSDDRIYTTHMDPFAPGAPRWTDWVSVASDASSDPAATFGDANTLYLAFLSQTDDTIELLTRKNGSWGPPATLGAPSVGAVSSPAIGANDPNSLSIVVRGGDNHLHLLDCTDPASSCARTASEAGGWMAARQLDAGGFVGAPSALWVNLYYERYLMVAAVGQDGVAWIGSHGPNGWGNWTPLPLLDLDPLDPTPGAVVQAFGNNWGEMSFYARNRRGVLINKGLWAGPPPLGGVLASPPSAVSPANGGRRVDVAALINDHGKLGVWWRFRTSAYQPPCNYNQPGTCAQCGCNTAGKPRCDL